jgi:N-acetylglutamate synthase-like GNAT family acetyltransferase
LKSDGKEKMIRTARMEDVKAMYKLLQHFAEKDLLLGRSLSSLYDQLRDFNVYVDADPSGPAGKQQVVGVCALHICWENLAEIRSPGVYPHLSADFFPAAGIQGYRQGRTAPQGVERLYSVFQISGLQ